MTERRDGAVGSTAVDIGAPRGVRGLLARFVRNRRGVAAIEFAFIAPVLLSLYFVTMEVSQGIETNKKVGRIASMVGDLVTQLPQTTAKAEVEAIMNIGGAILQPYHRSKPTITVTAIQITDEETPEVKVAWSRKLTAGAFGAGETKGSSTTVPATLKIKGSFLIRVTAELDYKPVIVWTAEQKTTLGLAAAFDHLPMSETYLLRPRASSDIDCTNC